MEYIAGEDLAKQISHKQLSIIEAVEIILKVASAVEHAHSKGIIHRDLKPSNVLWHEFRGPVVTDFGLAKDLRKSDYFSIPDQLLGTPSFMAPEQADRRFGEIAEQTDVYGLGATFYALLTGQPPIVGRSLVEVLNQLTSDTPIPSPQKLRLEIDNNLSAICMKSLAKQPMQRYPTIATFSADLQRWLKGEQRESQDPNATPRFDTPNMQNTDLAPGCRFGRFQMIELISGNTEWKVFRAADDLGNPILLKCLPQELLQDANARSRFRQEVLFASQVSHPCLAKVVEAGTLQQIEYVALEFVVGQNLAERISEQGPLDEALAIDILTRIAEALHLLHHAGILFRDLRPQNICLDHRKQPRLVEHRLSRENLDACTLKPEKNGVDLEALSYQAPEFWLNQTETVANDIYMLGATLFTLLTGEPPFASDLDHIRLMLAKNAGHFKSVKSFAQGSSDAIDELIKSCLQPDPAKRPSTAHEFAERLTACAVSEMRGFIGAYNTGPKVSQILADDNVQFSVFRLKSIPPDVWQPLLAFAHLAELPQDASPEIRIRSLKCNDKRNKCSAINCQCIHHLQPTALNRSRSQVS